MVRQIVQTRMEKMANSIRHEIILYWSKEDQAFIAEVPELPGCAADGATYEERYQRRVGYARMDPDGR